MVLLYFKVASALLSAPCDVEDSAAIAIPNGFNVPLVLLSFFIVIGALGYIMMQHNIFVVLLALPMLFVFSLPTIVRRMDRYDRSQPYHCGEKSPLMRHWSIMNLLLKYNGYSIGALGLFLLP